MEGLAPWIVDGDFRDPIKIAFLSENKNFLQLTCHILTLEVEVDSF